MPQNPIETNNRLSLRIAAEDKSLLLRAAVLQHSHLTEFVIRHAVSMAHQVIRQHEQLELTHRDSQQILDLLDNPPAPNARLQAAAFGLPDMA